MEKCSFLQRMNKLWLYETLNKFLPVGLVIYVNLNDNLNTSLEDRFTCVKWKIGMCIKRKETPVFWTHKTPTEVPKTRIYTRMFSQGTELVTTWNQTLAFYRGSKQTWFCSCSQWANTELYLAELNSYSLHESRHVKILNYEYTVVYSVSTTV